jgi:hypothetical protein
MAGLNPAINVLANKEGVDARDKPGHDGASWRGHFSARKVIPA